MSSTFTPSLRLEKQTTGENDATWGDKLDTVIDLIDSAIAGMTTIATTGGNTTLTANSSAADESRSAILKITGVLAANAVIIIPAQTKQYTVWNATTGAYTVTVKTSGGTGAAVTQAKRATIFCDATDCYRQDDDVTTGGAAATFPTGTRMVFQQTAAPTGWTKDTSVTNDCVMRLVTGSVSSGGADAFSTLFGTSKTTAGFTLTTNELPVHSHSVSDPTHTHTISDPTHAHALSGSIPQILDAGQSGPNDFAPGSHLVVNAAASAAASGVSNVAAATGIAIQNAGSGAAHSHALSSMNLKYYDFIIAAAA